MSNRGLAGAAALLAGPLTIIAAVIAIPTLSDNAADQVAALDAHRNALLTGVTLQTITIVLFTAGTIWLALALSRHAPGLAYAGGLLGVGGALVVLCVDSMHAAGLAAAMGSQPGRATHVLDQVLSSRALAVVEPLQMLQDVGLVLLAVAAAKAGVARWAAGAFAVGAVAEAVGFAAGSRAVVGVAFTVLLAGLVPTVVTLAGGRSPRSVPSARAAAA